MTNLIKRLREPTWKDDHTFDGLRAEAADEIERLRAEGLAFKLALSDAFDAIDYAASEGFEWPKNQIIFDMRHCVDTYCSTTPLSALKE